jgi:hypothetical protein
MTVVISAPDKIATTAGSSVPMMSTIATEKGVVKLRALQNLIDPLHEGAH